jgi:membrane associated rhomboid family serine protease
MVAGGLILIHGFVELAGGAERSIHWYSLLGLSHEGLGKGWLWQFLTHALLHGNWTHVLLNGLFLGYFGARVSSILGVRVFWQVLGAGVAAGGLFHLLSPSGDALVGSSGGIFALILWYSTVSPESRMWPIPLSARNFGLGLVLASMILAALSFVPGLGESGGIFAISHLCHLGGGLAGMLMARWLLRPRANLAELRARREKREGRHEGGLR